MDLPDYSLVEEAWKTLCLEGKVSQRWYVNGEWYYVAWEYFVDDLHADDPEALELYVKLIAQKLKG